MGLVQLELIEGGAHVPQPGVALGGSDDERGVAHTEPGVPALLIITDGVTHLPIRGITSGWTANGLAGVWAGAVPAPLVGSDVICSSTWNMI